MKQTGERGAHAPRSPSYTLSLFHSTVAVLFCMTKQIEEGKRFSSKYADKPEEENNCYYFNAKDKFYQEFNEAETFDAQVELVARLIDDVCMYYLK